MPYTLEKRTEQCTVCSSEANIYDREHGIGQVVDCVRCGDFQIAYNVAMEFNLPCENPKDRALASHVIRKMQKPGPDPG
jgi:hypothetical protein